MVDAAPPRGSLRWVKRGLVGAAFVGAALLLRGTLLSPKPVPVTVFRVAAGRVEETVTNSKAGTVKSRRRAALSPETAGRVARLPVRKGGHVAMGDVVLRLFDADARAQVAAQEKAVEAGRAAEREAAGAERQAQRELDRNVKLLGERIVSEERVDLLRSQRDQALASRDAALARLRQSEASLEIARVALDKTVLRAPFEGVVADIGTEVGEWITPSPPGVPLPPVVILLDERSIYVSAPMDEVDVGRVAEGQPVRLTFDAFPEKAQPGKVTRVAPYVQDLVEQNRTFEIEVELEDEAFASALRPGTSADVEVILGARDGVPRIPSHALMEGGKVLLVRGERLVAAPVRTGLRNWAFVEVTSGLSPGDLVVVSLDRAEVKDGAKARIEAETLR